MEEWDYPWARTQALRAWITRPEAEPLPCLVSPFHQGGGVRRLQVYMRCRMGLFSQGSIAMNPNCHTLRADHEQSGELSQDQLDTVHKQCQPCWCQRLYFSGCMPEGQGFWSMACAQYLSYQITFLSIATA